MVFIWLVLWKLEISILWVVLFGEEFIILILFFINFKSVVYRYVIIYFVLKKI